MNVSIQREDHRSLEAYAAVSIAFEVSEIVDVATLRLGSSQLTWSPTSPSWTKDYDALSPNGPLGWASRYVINKWVFLAAYSGNAERLGGAAVVIDQAGIMAVGGRLDYAMLWDLRVASFARRHSIGGALLAEVEVVARQAGYRGLQVETQDINVAACRLYAANHFAVTGIISGAYDDAPTETQLIWTKEFRAPIQHYVPAG
jgi:ribosomal protein S18 acetylase RimI-like enzyme